MDGSSSRDPRPKPVRDKHFVARAAASKSKELPKFHVFFRRFFSSILISISLVPRTPIPSHSILQPV